MNAPHVRALKYSLLYGKNVDYDSAPPLFEETDEFKLSINERIAIFEMKKHYTSAEEARSVIEDYLRAWDIIIGLQHNPDDLVFKFDGADVIDLSPTNNYRNVINLDVQVVNHVHALDNVMTYVSRGEYPAPPKQFVASKDSELMFLRYSRYRQNRETLTNMANFCLTTIEQTASEQKEDKLRKKKKENKRQKAGQKYGIDKEVLNKLAILCAKKGDRLDARKFPNNGKFEPLSQDEKNWIQSVIKAIIRRAGEVAFDPNAKLNKITMKDFPNINT